jgi:hypothetical protein
MAESAGNKWRPWAVSTMLPVRMKRSKGTGRKRRGERRKMEVGRLKIGGWRLEGGGGRGADLARWVVKRKGEMQDARHKT